ncbi:MAG: SRPBCC domain-containing protein [Candidatus Aminicenantes bacterium]|nr:SRPBCC domain-containing protein [Candidatus Aminicenantes bacterium]
MKKQDKIFKLMLAVIAAVFFVTISRVGIHAGTAETQFSMEGKTKTDRFIILNYVIDAPADKVFELWTTVDGTRKFFGKDAVIELKPGGKYEIYFLPRTDPMSIPNSTKGARLMWIKKGKELAFEWTAPPWAAALNKKPLPTWVVVNFRPLKNKPGKTHIILTHQGFKRAGSWDRTYEFFVRNWSGILFRLDLYFAAKK